MLLLAAEAADRAVGYSLKPLLEDYGIPLAIMGILVVYAALVLVTLFISLLPRLIAGLERLHPEPKDEAKTAKAPESDDALPKEILVVIAAAVAEAIDRPHRIVRIRGLTPEELGWSLEGRIQHHTSHRIQPRNRR